MRSPLHLLKRIPCSERTQQVTSLSVVFVLLLCTWYVIVFEFLPTECGSNMDCSLNGECIRGICFCESQWLTPHRDPNVPGSGGPPCSVLNVQPAPEDAPGFVNASWPSWGGRPVFNPEDRLWHLFQTQFANECSVEDWKTNSFVAHATSTAPNGPWQVQGVALLPFAHNPQAVLHPDGTWLLFFIGGWHPDPATWKDCRTHQGGAFEPRPDTGPGLGPTDDGCGGDSSHDNGCGIRLAHAKTPFGPWTVETIDFVQANGSKADTVYCKHSNPGPFVTEDGNVFLSFQGGSCHGGLESIAIARAPSWRGPYKHLTGNPIGSFPREVCPTGQFAEDPFLWKDHRGFHMIAHSLCDWSQDRDLYAMYAYSLDAVNWNIAVDPVDGTPTQVYGKNVKWDLGNGKQRVETIKRMERPALVLDKHNKPMQLINAVCRGPRSVGSCGDAPSWTLYRPIGNRRVAPFVRGQVSMDE